MASGTPVSSVKQKNRRIHWPGVDEDISVLGLVAGQPSLELKPASSEHLMRVIHDSLASKGSVI